MSNTVLDLLGVNSALNTPIPVGADFMSNTVLNLLSVNSALNVRFFDLLYVNSMLNTRLSLGVRLVKGYHR